MKIEIFTLCDFVCMTEGSLTIVNTLERWNRKASVDVCWALKIRFESQEQKSTELVVSVFDPTNMMIRDYEFQFDFKDQDGDAQIACAIDKIIIPKESMKKGNYRIELSTLKPRSVLISLPLSILS